MTMEITAITKLRHTALFELVKRLGGREAAAEQVGIGVQTFDKWLKLSHCFPLGPKGSFWTKELWQAVKDNLESLTGQTIEELFPESLRKAVQLRSLAAQVEQVMEVPEEALLAYAETTAERLRLPEPVIAAEQDELKTAIDAALKFLDARSREIVRMRFGITDGRERTLKEVGRIVGLNPERVRQIEARAVCKLQRPELAKALSGFLD